MKKKLNEFVTRVITAIFFGTLFWGTLLLLPPFYFSFLLVLVLLIMLIEWSKFPTWSWLIAPAYPILPIVLLISLNQNPYYHNLLYVLFSMVFSHDTGAYVVGSLLGKHKILPSISPKKSWEGFVGGFVSAMLCILIITTITQKGLSLVDLFFISFCVTVLATVGDFFESWLKRKADLKNSGSLLPGHGGLLDRFDSVLAATFFFFFLRNFLVLVL